jgi:predicted lipoprotein with Yx(FWY)xxD motif
MTPSRAITLLAGAAAAVLAALAVAGCGNSGSHASSAAPKPRPPTVKVTTSKLGKILVDSKGRTLYLFKQDKGTRTTCFDSCAKAWPPLRTNGKPTTGGEARARKVGTAPRPDGARQVTYNGHPLYIYEGDETPGKVNGQGVNAWGGRWFVLSPAGKQITKGSPPKGSSGY